MAVNMENPAPGRWAILRQFGLAHAVILCLIVYLTVTASGVLMAGNNSDDWRDLAGAPGKWAELEGRWFMDVIYRYVLGERPLLPLQIVLAFGCMFATSRILARHVAEKAAVPMATVMIFVFSTNHLYMGDILHFNSHLFAFQLAILLSVVSIHLLTDRFDDAGWARRFGLMALAVLLVSLALAIYQPYAIVGFIIPLLGMISPRARSFRATIAILGICLLVAAGAYLLYVFSLDTFIALSGRDGSHTRFDSPDAEELRAKLADLPAMIRSFFTGGLLYIPLGLKLVVVLVPFLAFLTMALNVLLAFGPDGPVGFGDRLWRASAVVLGTVLILTITPFIFWFTYKDTFLPPRAVAYAGTFIATAFLANLNLMRTLGRHVPAVSRYIVACKVAFAGVCAVLLITASQMWSELAATAERDVELARSIYARATALPGYDGGAIRLVGGLQYDDLSWGGSIGRTVFHENNDQHGIFREMFNTPWHAESISLSPRACPAFPADGSVFLHDGAAYVCLAAMKDIRPRDNCLDLPELGGTALCVNGTNVVQLFPGCRQPPDPKQRIYVWLRDSTGAKIRIILKTGMIYFELNGDCYRGANLEHDIEQVLSVGGYESGVGTLWSEDTSGLALGPLPDR